MASTTKIKAISNVGFTSNITIGGIYTVLATTDTQFSIVDDLTNTILVPKSLFKMHYEISALNELLPSTVGETDGAWTVDSYGVKYRVISATSTQIRLNSIDEDTVETIAITFTNDFGGVTRVLAYLTFLGFAINYTQDPTLTFVDRDVFVQFCKTQTWKYSETYEGVRIITDSTGNTIVENLVGLSLTFA